MIELPDDELDKLFRKSSEEFDPYFDPKDWNDLKNRLDEVEGIRPAGWLRRWWPLGMLLLFLSGGLVSYLLVDKKDATNNVSAVASFDAKKSSERSSEIKVAESIKPPGATVSERPGEAIPVKTLPENKSLTKSKSEKILPPSRSKAGGVYLEPNRSNGKVGEGAISSNVKKEVSESANKNKTAAGQPLKEKKETGSDSNNRLAVRSEKVDNNRVRREGGTKSSQPDPGESLRNKRATDRFSGTLNDKKGISEDDKNDINNRQVIDSITLTTDKSERSAFSQTEMLFPKSLENVAWPLPEVVPASPIDEPVQTEEPSWPSPRFAVRAGYSPDLTTVGLKNLSKPGASVSLLAEYGVTKRLFFQTGVIWSNKIYRAQAADYTVPRKPQHYYGPDPVGVDGTCKVFEIPMNLQYAFFQGSDSRVFAGVGSSSYHMNSEVYRYKFENENDPKIGNWRGWQGSTGWYWFSNVNASAGYERRISRTLSVVAEPYVRIPVKKVGYGKVNLFTAGMWLSVRYAPFSR